MQVRPVSAIHALRIRQKPSAEFVPNSDLFTVSEGTFSDIDLMPAHLAAEELQRDLHAGSHAEYATQLLAGRDMSVESEMERQLHLAQYATATEDSESHSFTISLSA
ncbi:hypothetical protein [uncultured Roseibium sp.]|uniref:hypothetical protein n=1 Tax=uncultured Roseibium sp. TaxID=1936171 RepID=UPI002616D325|nr:hypothetical protein [uncultured Roseibium sp.]